MLKTSSPEIKSTYRLQLNKGFQFQDVIKHLQYFKKLGVSHLYLSPIFQATPGSMHGYDVTDYNKISDELGGENAFNELCTKAKDIHLGIVLDFVPNHMANNHHNHWWMQALKNGPRSNLFKFFDIRLESPEDKIYIPVLGETFEEAIEQNKFSITADQTQENYFVNYYDHKFPLNDKSLEFLKVNFMFAYVPLEELSEDPMFVRKLLDLQYYRLDYWKFASQRVNYRRFFNINSLIGTNMDDDEVFEESHKLLFTLIAENKIDGVRIDHPDGLSNPKRYFERFQNKVKEISKLKNEEKPFYLLVEKILSHDEKLREDWLVHGTTGYEFGSGLNKVFVDQNGFNEIQDFYKNYSKQNSSVEALIKQSKEKVIDELFQAEINYLYWQLVEENSALTPLLKEKGIDEDDLGDALRQILINFPIYRTYIEKGKEIASEDREVIHKTISNSKADLSPSSCSSFDSRAVSEEVFDELEKLFLPQGAYNNSAAYKFIREFQQLTCSVLAKGVEDTFHYRFYPLASLNEVGCEPFIEADPIEKFHQNNKLIQQKWPLSMLSTSTHDSKRSEDVRARINALSQFSSEWIEAIKEWSKLNQKAKDQSNFQDPNIEYLFYQTFVGVVSNPELLSLSGERSGEESLKRRIKDCLIKSTREAKIQTNWEEPNQNYENALVAFVDICFESQEFIESISNFSKKASFLGKINSISQLILKLTSPGIPDIYQGNELFQYQLVDPDNRQKIDFESRSKLLNDLSIKESDSEHQLDSEYKLWVTQKLLQFRQSHSGLFLDSEYQELKINGDLQDSFLAFQRKTNLNSCIVIVPVSPLNLFSRLSGGDSELSIQSEVWNDNYIEIDESQNLEDVLFGKVLEPSKLVERSVEKNIIYLNDLFSSSDASRNKLPFAVLYQQ